MTLPVQNNIPNPLSCLTRKGIDLGKEYYLKNKNFPIIIRRLRNRNLTKSKPLPKIES